MEICYFFIIKRRYSDKMGTIFFISESFYIFPTLSLPVLKNIILQWLLGKRYPFTNIGTKTK